MSEYLLEPVDRDTTIVPLMPIAYVDVAEMAYRLVEPRHAAYLYHETMKSLEHDTEHWRVKFARCKDQPRLSSDYSLHIKTIAPFANVAGIEVESRELIESYYKLTWFDRNAPKPSQDVIERFYEMPHEAYLKTTYWYIVRTLAVVAGGYRCERCSLICDRASTKATIHVHNLGYMSKGEEQLGDFQLLCAHCHMREHGIKKEKGVTEMAWKAKVKLEGA